MFKEYDCVIVGAGPAGLTAASRVAASGLSVAIIDKNLTPGMPVRCAELVPKRFIELLPFRLTRLHPINTMTTTISDSSPIETPSPGYLIDRAELSALGVRDAVKSGVEIIFGARAITISSNSITLIKNNKIIAIKARVIIGADGPGSTIARLLGMDRLPFLLAQQIKASNTAQLTSAMIFFDPRIVGGYGWAFPKENEITVGAGILQNNASVLRQALLLVMERLASLVGPLRSPFSQTEIFGIIPWKQRDRLGYGNCLFVGDAAGLTHPITGAGILTAVISGREAADSIVSYSSGGLHSMSDCIGDYSANLSSSLGSYLGHAAARRQLMMKEWTRDSGRFRQLIEATWVAFPQYRKRMPDNSSLE